MNLQHQYTDPYVAADKVPGWMSEKECRVLAAMATAMPHCSNKSWVEVGSFCGRSLMAVGMAMANDRLFRGLHKCDKQIFAVDHFEGLPGAYFDGMDKQRDPLASCVRVQRTLLEAGVPTTLLPCASTVAAKHFGCDSIHTLFLDDDHTWEGVKASAFAWWDRIEPMGWCAGHDYRDGWPDVEKFVDWAFHPESVVNPPGTSIWMVQKTGGVDGYFKDRRRKEDFPG